MAGTIEIAEEASPKKVFVWALEWPGWCRSGRDSEGAIEALAVAGHRYGKVVKAAGLLFAPLDTVRFATKTRVEGGSGTAFGVPSVITPDDLLAVEKPEAKRLASLVAASWLVFDGIAASAPEELRKGPRGGGRDTSQIVVHVNEADGAYAREIGIKLKPPADRAAVETIRSSILKVLASPSDGSPLAGRKWTQRYAARRIAWHALDHAWEIEDRIGPGPTPG